MEAIYKLTESEYVNGNKLFSQLNKSAKLRYSFFIPLLVLVAIFANSSAIKYGSAFAIVGGVIGHLISRHVYAPWVTRKQYRNYKEAQEETSVRVVDTGLEFENKDGRSILSWGNIYGWRENDELFLLYQAPHVYHIIPKSVESQGFDMQALVSILESKVENKT